MISKLAENIDDVNGVEQVSKLGFIDYGQRDRRDQVPCPPDHHPGPIDKINWERVLNNLHSMQWHRTQKIPLPPVLACY